MPGKIIDYSDDRQAVVYVRVPGWLKNLVSRAAEARGMSVNDWAANVLKAAAETGVGLPAPPFSKAPTPTRQAVVEDWLMGRQTVEPCGKPYPCERATAGTHKVGGLEFCSFCRIRVG